MRRKLSYEVVSWLYLYKMMCACVACCAADRLGAAAYKLLMLGGNLLVWCLTADVGAWNKALEDAGLEVQRYSPLVVRLMGRFVVLVPWGTFGGEYKWVRPCVTAAILFLFGFSCVGDVRPGCATDWHALPRPHQND